MYPARVQVVLVTATVHMVGAEYLLSPQPRDQATFLLALMVCSVVILIRYIDRFCVMITECPDQVRAGVRGPAADPGAGLPPGPRDQAGGGQPLQEEEGEARHRIPQIGAAVSHLFIVNCFMTPKINSL